MLEQPLKLKIILFFLLNQKVYKVNLLFNFYDIFSQFVN